MTTLEHLFRQWHTLAMIRSRRLDEVRFLLNSSSNAEDLLRQCKSGRFATHPNARWLPSLVRQIDSLERTIALVALSAKQEQRRGPTELVLH
jgi:hypothetical protein